MTEVLSQRSLNRATLARQYLLERAPARAIDAIEHLAGMQSQAPLAPYVGLWARLQGFSPGELSALTAQRQVVRLHLMRNTVHLVSARDCLDWRALFYPLHAADFSARFRGGAEGVDQDVLLKQAKRLLEQPRTHADLRRLLAEHWPGADPSALAYAAALHIALCQVPPRGIWSATGPAAMTPLETWLGRPLDPDPSLDALLLRYLGAFGPATVKDVQTWSGLTRLREVAERLRPGLRAFRAENGAELHDLPDAPRPDPDTPAPVRFLPEYDNLLLSHADRSRVNPDRHPVPLPPGNGGNAGTVLVDGLLRGTWAIARDGDGATLTVRPFAELSTKDSAAVAGEGDRLLAFTDPTTATRDIRVVA